MNKQDFFREIKVKLKDFSKVESDKILEYYEELINDYIDEGFSEEEAILKLGNIDAIINNLKADLVIERSNNKNTNSLKNFIIILSICTSPILIPIGISFFVVFFGLLIAMISVFISFAASSLMLVLASIYTSIEMIVLGTDIATILITLGTQLFAGAALGLGAMGIFNLSKIVLNYLNKQFSKFIKKKSNKEIKENV